MRCAAVSARSASLDTSRSSFTSRLAKRSLEGLAEGRANPRCVHSPAPRLLHELPQRHAATEEHYVCRQDDGARSQGAETESDIQARKQMLRQSGYKL